MSKHRSDTYTPKVGEICLIEVDPLSRPGVGFMIVNRKNTGSPENGIWDFSDEGYVTADSMDLSQTCLVMHVSKRNQAACVLFDEKFLFVSWYFLCPLSKTE